MSIDLFLLGKYFGEISKIRIKKSTLPYVVSMLCPITHLRFRLSFLLPEQVGVGAGVQHKQFQFVAYLLPYQQPVGWDAALSLALAVAVEHVWSVNVGQSSVAFKQLDDGTTLDLWSLRSAKNSSIG